MKKNLVGLAVMSIAMAGCSNQDLPLGTDLKSAPGIDFGVYVGNTTSRATATTDAELKTSGVGFHVWAYHTTLAAGTAGSIDANLEDAAVVTEKFKDAFTWDATTVGSEYWKGGVTAQYYWPDLDKGKMSFIALSPKAAIAAADLTGPLMDADDKSKLNSSFTYALKDVDAQEDLMAAQVYDKVEADGAVKLAFKHLLTQVSFSAKTAGSYRAKLISIKVKGVSESAKFTFDRTATAIGSWSDYAAVAADKEYPYTAKNAGDNTTWFPATPDYINNTALPIPGDNGQLMFIPKDDLNGVSIEVSYQCYEIGSDKVIGSVVTRVVELTEEENWKMNQRIRYTLNLYTPDINIITYSVKMSDWEDYSADGEIVDTKD